MKLHILSDLHNEFSVYTPHSESRDADVIVLAGDIWLGNKGIYWARETWPHQHIIYVAGNHEFYSGIRPEVLNSLRHAASESSVHFLENDEVIVNEVRFFGAILWTDFELFGIENKSRNMKFAETYLNDFRKISEESGGLKFTPTKSIELHIESAEYLQSRLSTKFEGKTVVITHHLPSMKSISTKYLEDPLSPCFASNLDYLIGKSDLWIHGHTHDSKDYVVGNTRVICNPRGYSTYKRDVENFAFDPRMLIDL